MTTWDEEEGRAERLHELRYTLAGHIGLTTEDIEAYPDRLTDDLWVEGPLSQIFEWAADWRSEIEELG